MEPTLKDREITGDIWRDSWGNIWYSEAIIDKIVEKCQTAKDAYTQGCLLADDILEMLSGED